MYKTRFGEFTKTTFAEVSSFFYALVDTATKQCHMLNSNISHVIFRIKLYMYYIHDNFRLTSNKKDMDPTYTLKINVFSMFTVKSVKKRQKYRVHYLKH